MEKNKLDFFDCNSMIGKWLAYPRFRDVLSSQDLISEMDYFGIEKSIVGSILAWQGDTNSGNNFLFDEVKNQNRLIPAFVADPVNFDNMLSTSSLLKTNLKIVRLFLNTSSSGGEDNIVLSYLGVSDIFKRLNQLSMPLLHHLVENGVNLLTAEGDPTYHFVPDYFWDKLFKLANQYPNFPIILTRVGDFQHTMLKLLMKKTDNVYFEFSGSQRYNGIEDLVSDVGPNRILFGTWLPFTDPGYSMSKLIYADISKKDKELISHVNLENLLGGVKIE